MKKYPFYVVLIALYPIISLYALNVSEVNLIDLFRPLALSLFLAIGFFWLLGRIIHGHAKSAFITAFIFIVFSSYGAMYNVTRTWHIGDLVIGRHRILFPALLIVLALFLWAIRKAGKDTMGVITQAGNVFSIVLLLFPVYTLASNQSHIRLPGKSIQSFPSSTQTLDQSYPDVYYFVLDSYARADYIQQYMKYDNSSFIGKLKEKGFYTVDCGLSNYSYTRLSLATTLNMEYLENLGPQFSTENTDESLLDPLIQDNRVMAEFKKKGYQTVAFVTGYPFTEFANADYFFQPDPEPFTKQVMTEFELMAINNTIFSVISQNDQFTKMFGLDFPYYQKWNTERFIIDKVKSLSEMPGPKFVFVHLVTTHRPYIFKSDGSILNDPHYYKNDGVPANDDYYIKGYQFGLDYTNAYMLDLIDTLQVNSKVPPIIIIQGDHGVREPGRISIINAISLPGQTDSFYASMTPVNTFRIILNKVFGERYEILPDNSFYASVNIKPYDLKPADNANSCKIQ